MANQDHIKILEQGVDTWNAWRASEHHIRLSPAPVLQTIEAIDS